VGLLFGRETRTSPTPLFPVPPIPPFPGADPGGFVTPSTNPDIALQIPTVWACVSLLANTISSLPLETFKRPKRNDASPIPKKLADSALMVEPEPKVTQSEWLHMVMVSLLLRGNCYGLITGRDSMMLPTGVHIVNPDSVSVRVNRDSGEVEYRWASGTGKSAVIPRDEIWHCKGLTLPGDVVGLSPISYAAAMLGIDLGARDFASQFFQGSGIPKAILQSDQQINAEQARTIKERVLAAMRGREPVVLGMGLDYQQIQVKPEESQFLKTMEANVTQIARFFTVPASMIDGPSGSSMTYTNVEQRAISFLTYSVGHWLKRLEDSIFPLLPGSQFVKFNVEPLLRLDAHTQTQVDLLRLAGKVVAPSEIRTRDGLPPMTKEQQEEIAMVPLTISPLGRPSGSAPLLTPTSDKGETPDDENPTGV